MSGLELPEATVGQALAPKPIKCPESGKSMGTLFPLHLPTLLLVTVLVVAFSGRLSWRLNCGGRAGPERCRRC